MLLILSSTEMAMQFLPQDTSWCTTAVPSAKRKTKNTQKRKAKDIMYITRKEPYMSEKRKRKQHRKKSLKKPQLSSHKKETQDQRQETGEKRDQHPEGDFKSDTMEDQRQETVHISFGKIQVSIENLKISNMAVCPI